jgi:phosphosulfolactate synthase
MAGSCRWAVFPKVNTAPSFLTVPSRARKPRQRGLTHVLDKGLPVDDVARVLQVCGPYVDVWKFGWGTAYLDPGVAAKLDVLRDSDVLACTGGTLLEVAWHQGVVAGFLDWAADLGFPCVEVSAGVAPIGPAEKADLIAAAAGRFVVLAEVGSKDPAAAVAPGAWGAAAAADRAAGATWVVTEGRESGTVGLFSGSGDVRGDVADAVVDAVGADCVVFEAPRKEQQAWLVRRFGADVGLGNLAPGEVLGVEALRLGLRADTFGTAVRR